MGRRWLEPSRKPGRPNVPLAGGYPDAIASRAADARKGGLSTAALELCAATSFAHALQEAAPFSALVIFTDSEAAQGAINSGTSGAPAMRPLVAAFFQKGVQYLATRVSTDENEWADKLSRGHSAAVTRHVDSLGWALKRLPPPRWEPLRQSASCHADSA